MNFAPTKEQLELKNTIIEFSQKYLNSNIAKRDQEQMFDQNLWKKCGELKLQGITISEEYGGAGQDILSAAHALEGLGYGCEDGGLCFAICAHLLACVMPIEKYGSSSQKERLLPSLCNGTLIAANAMTESSGGSDVYNMKTVAAIVEEGFRLNGAKIFCTNGPIADIILTYGLTDAEKGYFGGITAFLLEKGKHDFSSTPKIDKAGVRTCMMGDVHFDNLFLDKSAVLGKTGGGGMIFTRSMHWERILVSACHLGTMKRVLERTVQFVNKRHVGNQSIGSHQSISHQLADMKVQWEAARLLTYQAAWKLTNGISVNEDASVTKLFVSETFKNMMMQIMQIFAGKAYREHHEVERILRDALGSTIYSGTSAIQRNIIARQMGIK